jgi:hypothetical protein
MSIVIRPRDNVQKSQGRTVRLRGGEHETFQIADAVKLDPSFSGNVGDSRPPNKARKVVEDVGTIKPKRVNQQGIGLNPENISPNRYNKMCMTDAVMILIDGAAYFLTSEIFKELGIAKMLKIGDAPKSKKKLKGYMADFLISDGLYRLILKDLAYQYLPMPDMGYMIIPEDVLYDSIGITITQQLVRMAQGKKWSAKQAIGDLVTLGASLSLADYARPMVMELLPGCGTNTGVSDPNSNTRKSLNVGV